MAARDALRCGLLAALVAGSLGCRQDMHDQPRYDPLEASAFFDDGMAARRPVPGTVARGLLHADQAFYGGRTADGELVRQLPIEPTDRVLRRGAERYGIFCSPCHGLLGDGRGMVVRRGFQQPPSFHTEATLQQPVGYYFDVMTQGFGRMPSYGGMISAEDRWAIAAFIKVLQFSQQVPVAELPEADRSALEATAQQVPTAADRSEEEGAAGH